MIVRLLRVFTAGVIFTFATGAQAQGQDPKLWYVAVGAGAAWSSGLSVTGTTTGTVNLEQPVDEVRFDFPFGLLFWLRFALGDLLLGLGLGLAFGNLFPGRAPL